MNFLIAVFRQTFRNLFQTKRSQLLTLLTVTLSVLIFAFFYLVYTNAIQAGQELDDDLRLIIYLEEEPSKVMQEEYRNKITKFDKVEKINFVSKKQAYERFAQQLGEDRDVLVDMPEDFLPPSIEVYPVRSLDTLTKIKRFSDYLVSLPGVLKVQYGREWVERFNYFTELLRVIVILSGFLLIMTTTFMVAYTIRLAVLARQAELEILRLLGATNNYIRTPFLIEGFLQGALGSGLGLAALYFLFRWIQLRFSGPGILQLVDFTFFPPLVIGIIIAASITLCIGGSFSSMRKFMRI